MREHRTEFSYRIEKNAKSRDDLVDLGDYNNFRDNYHHLDEDKKGENFDVFGDINDRTHEHYLHDDFF